MQPGEKGLTKVRRRYKKISEKEILYSWVQTSNTKTFRSQTMKEERDVHWQPHKKTQTLKVSWLVPYHLNTTSHMSNNTKELYNTITSWHSNISLTSWGSSVLDILELSFTQLHTPLLDVKYNFLIELFIEFILIFVYFFNQSL